MGGVDASFKLAGDWDLWRRFAQHEELIHIDRQLGAFYFRKGQKSADVSRYAGECEACRPMAARVADFRRLLSADPELGVTRITTGDDRGLVRSHERVGSLISEKIRFALLPLSAYFRNLRRRHQALRRRHERRADRGG